VVGMESRDGGLGGISDPGTEPPQPSVSPAP